MKDWKWTIKNSHIPNQISPHLKIGKWIYSYKVRSAQRGRV